MLAKTIKRNKEQPDSNQKGGGRGIIGGNVWGIEVQV